MGVDMDKDTFILSILKRDKNLNMGKVEQILDIVMGELNKLSEEQLVAFVKSCKRNLYVV